MFWQDRALIEWILWAMALYGLTCAADEVIRRIRRLRLWKMAPNLSLLLFVQNQEEQVEGVLRLLVDTLHRLPPETGEAELLVVDLASVDATVAVVERLMQAEPAIRLLSLSPAQVTAAREIAARHCRAALTLTLNLQGAADVRRLVRTVIGLCS